jgi:3-deoxy-D-manno-octulosonate 8-phosphate phosphatase (KDO 8-P phosphatase)
MEAGIGVGLVTGRRSDALHHRCKDLGIIHIYDGVSDKAAILKLISEQTNVAPEKMAFVGDDLPDLPLMRRVGVSIAVADAHEAVIEKSAWVTSAGGGAGAVREICEAILKTQGLWEKILGQF